jgi:hypothetical protein
VLWVVDHILRLHRCLSYRVQVDALQMTASDGIVRLSYSLSQQPNSAPTFQHEMGQYCFVNIPEISQLAWHPFTISSCPRDVMITHHIKQQCAEDGKGPNNQWTNRLVQFAKQLQQHQEQRQRSPEVLSSILRNLVVNIDGPYGFPLNISKYRCILFLGGGIGITPLHACYRHIFQCCYGVTSGYSSYDNNVNGRRNDDTKTWMYYHLQKVRLVWAVKERKDMLVFEESVSARQRFRFKCLGLRKHVCSYMVYQEHTCSSKIIILALATTQPRRALNSA